MNKTKTHELTKRLLFTLLILAVYMAGRSLLLYKVDSSAYQLEELNSQNIMFSMISGDRYQYTIFALGIMPYITATLLMWIYMAIRGSEFRARSSPQKTERMTLIVMLLLAASFAISRADGLIFRESKLPSEALKMIAVVEMIAGAFVIHKMANWNKTRGIGGQTPIKLVNILDNLFSTLQKFSWEAFRKPLLLCLVMTAAILVMENVLIRIPVQRVSIHNLYADKSYLAFKLDPIGVMPVMFAVSVFMIPQLMLRILMFLYEDNRSLQTIYESLNLTNPAGAAVYLVIIFVLNLLFSFSMLTPGEMAKQLQKGGDSIVNIYAGKKTKWYLRRKLLLLCVFSGCAFCLMMGFSLWLSLSGAIEPELALFPATAMILVGILCPLYREVKTYRKFDSYSFFILD